MKDNRLGVIFLDGIILFAVSVVLAVASNAAFSLIKPPKDNPIVSAIDRGKQEGLVETLGKVEKEAGSEGVDMADEHGRTALMRAAYGNLSNRKALAELDETRVPMATLLVERGADVNGRDGDGWTPLMWAAWSGLPKVVDVLLEAGADVAPVEKQGNSALIIAARRGHAEIVTALLARGADRGHTNQAGQNALAAALLGQQEHAGGLYKEMWPGYRTIVSELE